VTVKAAAVESLADRARRLVADWPPLAPTQRARLAVLLGDSVDRHPEKRAA